MPANLIYNLNKKALITTNIFEIYTFSCKPNPYTRNVILSILPHFLSFVSSVILSIGFFCAMYTFIIISTEGYKLTYQQQVDNPLQCDMKLYEGVYIDIHMIRYYFTVPPSSLSIENATPSNNRLVGTEGQDLTVSCKAVGGTPSPNVILIIDGQSKANQTRSGKHTFTNINRSYDHKIVTCQANNPAYQQISMTVSALIYLNCK